MYTCLWMSQFSKKRHCAKTKPMADKISSFFCSKRGPSFRYDTQAYEEKERKKERNKKK